MWEKGNTIIDGIPLKYEAKVFKEPSILGIEDGRVSKLEVVKDLGDGRWHADLVLLQYDRGWGYQSNDAIAKKALDYILQLYN